MNRYSGKDETSYILGISLTIEAIRHIPEKMECVYLSSRCIRNRQYDELIALCRKNSIEVIEDDKVIDTLSVKENCYGIGVFRKYRTELSGNRHIILYGFNDYGELGTIMRSAAAFDFSDIILVDSAVDYFDPRTVRASMGAIFHLNVKTADSLNEIIREYGDNLYAFTGDGRIELGSITFPDSYALLIPQKYHELDGRFKKAHYVDHEGDEISLSALSSIVFNYCYHQI